ncbi:hypothetical protein [Arenicella xantha]|uniref:Uncharacterized protein n=1 Tax=Arenicella xantha TaxID=644221 RepID=A0A395JM41_9GAMM|nr:hypothetical protein [Arenicella xantha]RBP52714.1 hypothetical protein DFR28_10196 [Arenicella xantha]
MQLLKIENNQGFFLDENDDFLSVEKITKEHLLRLVDLTLTKDVTFDEFNEEALQNRAHQIVYKNIYEKLVELQGKRDDFTDESARLYLEDYNKYQQDIADH